MDMETRIARLEAAESIRILKAHYCDLCDTGYDEDQLGALFTHDAVWDGGDLGAFEGVETIKRFFRNMPRVLSFAIHHVSNSAVDVAADALAATGTWYLLQPATMATSDQAVWIAGRYHDEFVKEDGIWRFSRITIDTRFFTPSGSGWAHTPFLQAGPANS